MSTEQKKPSMVRLGYFSEPGYTSIGDQYRTKQALQDSRYKNRQILGGTNRNPKYFSKPGRLFENDLYKTWDEIQRKWRNEKSKKAIGGAAFKPPNPTKINSGLGDYYGAFGPKLVHEPENEPKKREKVVHSIRNIITAPPKRGSYGTFGTILGYRRNFKGSAGEFAYIADPYDAAHQKAVERAKAARKSQESRPPFRPCNPSKKGGPGYSTRGFTKIEYVSAPPVDTKSGKIKKENADGPPAFKPSHPPRSGYKGAFSKFPEHKPDPYDHAEAVRKEDFVKTQATLKKLGDRSAFVAASCSKSTRTPSVFRMNIKLK